MPTYTYKSSRDLRAEKREVYDRKIILDRLRGFSNGDCGRMNACTSQTIANASEEVWRDGLQATGATLSWPDVWRSAPILSDHQFWKHYLRVNG